MFSLVLAVLRSLVAGFHARRHFALENLALRHQLLVLNRTIKTPGSPQLRPAFLGRAQRDVVAVDEGGRTTSAGRPRELLRVLLPHYLTTTPPLQKKELPGVDQTENV
jgi:hypothetical protein